jgi:hypothetical protein
VNVASRIPFPSVLLGFADDVANDATEKSVQLFEHPAGTLNCLTWA